MAEENKIRIFCPTHEAAFDVAESPKIICEITEHALSIGFPNSEFWEFCCNCEAFSPSGLDKGEKARKNCFSCGNEISKFFVCSECKIVGFESTAYTKGKSYSVTAKGIEPDCPGCHVSFQDSSLISHECKEIGANILTLRKVCPFCFDQISSPIKDANQPTQLGGAAVPRQCPQCRAFNPPSTFFCGHCRHQLRADAAVANLGSSISQTQLLGSLCPNCSAPVPSDSSFCGECGQAVKKSPPPPPPPPKKKEREFPTLEFPVPATKTPARDNTVRNVAFGVGGFFLFLVILAIASSSSRSSSGSLSSSSANNSSTESNSNFSRASTENSPTRSFSLPDSFERDYQGTINGQSLSLSLVKSGSGLKGTASTYRSTDTLSGRIESDGSFQLNGYENGNRFTGIYTGQIHSDGSIAGNWTTPSGTKETSFYLDER